MCGHTCDYILHLFSSFLFIALHCIADNCVDDTALNCHLDLFRLRAVWIVACCDMFLRFPFELINDKLGAL